jgi:dTMP kinase
LAAGTFIAFEGLDGSGKTTAIRAVSERLRSEGLDVVVTREPGGTELGTRIRSLIFEYAETMSATTELLLMCADRAEHVQAIIRPALNDGKIVISDRYAASTIAYQGYGRGVALDVVFRALDVAIAGLEPDLTILFDIDLAAADQRRAGDTSNINALDLRSGDFRSRVRQGFLDQAAAAPNWTTIKAAGTPEDVAIDVYAAVSELLSRRIVPS